MSSPMDTILSNLERVRANGKGWLASCPGPIHQNGDRHPSLSVKESDTGNVLLRCHAGCQTRDIVGALGLTMGDLFAQPLAAPERKRRATHGLLKALCAESLRVIVAASPIGPPLTPEDMARLKTATARLRAALTLDGLQGRGEIRRIADFGDRLLAGEVLDEIEREALTDNVKWIAWLIADETKPGGKARLQGAKRYA